MKNFANREVCDLIIEDYATGEPWTFIDYANVTTNELTGETVFAYGGKGHPKRVAFTGERGGTLAIETQLMNMKLYSFITGADIEKSAKIYKREKVKCETADTLTVSQTPVVGTIVVFPEEDDCGAAVTGDATATGKEISLPGLKANDTYIVYYITEKTTGVQKINIKSSTFPKSFRVYADTFQKTEDDEVLAYHMTAYKCIPQSNFSVSFSNNGDPATITITCDLMADEDLNLLDYVLDEGEAA